MKMVHVNAVFIREAAKQARAIYFQRDSALG